MDRDLVTLVEDLRPQLRPIGRTDARRQSAFESKGGGVGSLARELAEEEGQFSRTKVCGQFTPKESSRGSVILGDVASLAADFAEAATIAPMPGADSSQGLIKTEVPEYPGKAPLSHDPRAQEGDVPVDWLERYIQRLDEDVRGLQASFDSRFDKLDRQLTAVVREGLEQARHLDEARQREFTAVVREGLEQARHLDETRQRQFLDLGSEMRGTKNTIIGLFVATLLGVGGMVLAVLLAVMASMKTTPSGF